MITYTPIASQDYDGLLALWTKTKGVRVRADEDSYEGLIRILDRNPDSCFVARGNGEIVGSILCGQDGKRAYVYHLAVSESFRRRQIAQKLLSLVTNVIQAMGIPKISLVVFKDNSDGNAFWKHMGAMRRDDLFYYDLDVTKLCPNEEKEGN